MSIVELERTVELLRRERDEALAQVALLVELCERVRCAEDPEEYLRDLEVMLEGDRIAKARALLDRLQRAEAVVKAVRSWGTCCGLCGLAYSRVQIALAAWEEGKHP